MEIQKAGRDDIQLLTTLIRGSFKDVAERFNLTRDNAPTHPSFADEAWMEAAMDRGIRFYVLENDGRPCGCVALEEANPEVFYLERLAVLPTCRRQGHGEALVRHVLERARDAGAERVEIGVISDQVELARWYGRMGFVEKDRTRFEHLPFEVTFMVFNLTG